MKPDPGELPLRRRTLGEESLLPRLDIVIVNWNAGALLQRCLDSIAAAGADGLVLNRVVVVDNASSDTSLAALAQPKPPFTVIRNTVNAGFAAACNRGASGSNADYLLFLNPDVILDPDSLEGAVAFMEAKDNQEIDISGIRLRDAEGRTQRCCARFPTPGRMVGHAFALDKLLPGLAAPHFLTDWDHEDSRDVPQVMGAFLLIRRAAFERLDGFDERFFLYYEDVDLCRRLAAAGGRCAHNAAVGAVHIGGGTTSAIKARRQFLSARSRILYTSKHFGALAAAAVGLAALVGEPAMRLLRGVARRSAQEVADTAKGAWMLWRAVPGLVARGGRASRAPRSPSILALTRYPRQGASSRTRFLAYLPALREAGFTVEVSPFFDETYLGRLYEGRPQRRLSILASYGRRLAVLRRIRSFDLVWIEKEALPWLPLAAEKLLLRRAAFVLDYDDAWFLRYAGHPLRPLLEGKLDGLIRHARATLVGNDYLAAWARNAGAQRIVELPTPVPFEKYRERPARRPGGPLQIGWIGTPSSAVYLRPLVPALARAVREGWAAVTVVGAKDPALAAIGPVTFLPWSEEAEVECLHRFDVGIMPLADDDWSQGKCAYKLIQYMAVGLPVVASPIGMNRKVVRHGESGFLAGSEAEWLTALRTLAEDPELCRRMGEAGRRRVEQDYALAPATPRLIETLKAAAGR